ncbi:penicillin-binding protein 2, partial [Candidatus Curtissbacteria bacterium]|nr:penicillin-binding protein 2 [Candidatus Curtissbacteria bacterium]
MDRIKIFQIIAIIVAILIILRLFYWQFIAKIASGPADYLSESEIPASRGEIYASDNFPLVTNQEAFLIYGKPNELRKNPQEIAKLLAPYLISEKYATAAAQLTREDQEAKDEEVRKKEEELAAKLSNKKLYWVQLARKVPLEVKGKIEKIGISGLGFESDEKRFYPEASMAAQLLGFVGFDKFGRDTGYFGLEGFWDRKLRGKTGRLGQEQDPYGLPILVGKYRRIPPQKGASLYLSLDRTVQFIVEEKLRLAVEKYGAKEGTVIVANPKNGQILAMATYPTYNSALRLEYDEKLYKNPAVADTFEPGSVFKIVAMSAVLDLSLLEPKDQCPNSTMTEIIEHSDNVGMTYVAEKLGIDRLYDYIAKFGFGKLTGIDLQEETPGNLREKDEWRPIDLATASFGQGIALTPIQMIQAVGAIANGGKLISPQVVVKIKEGNDEEENRPQERQVISAKTASQITEMMVNAVERGEARVFAPKGYRIAGKTGTAQIPIAGHYDPEKTIASFVGFAPAD